MATYNVCTYIRMYVHIRIYYAYTYIHMYCMYIHVRTYVRTVRMYVLTYLMYVRTVCVYKQVYCIHHITYVHTYICKSLNVLSDMRSEWAGQCTLLLPLTAPQTFAIASEEEVQGKSSSKVL